MNSDIINNVQGYEFSENQKNIWFLEGENQQVFYNKTVLKFYDHVSTEELKSAIDAIVKKHDVLRLKTHYDKKFAYPVQFFSDESKSDYHEIDGNEEDIIALVNKELEYAYDPSVNSPIRFCAVKVAGEIKYLGVKLYALWGDVYSTVFFCNELSQALKNIQAYESEEIEKVDYLNFCAWQSELINEPEEEAVQFWKTYNYQLNQKIVPFSKTSEIGFNSQKKLIYTIEGEEYEKLNQYCSAHNLEKGDFLLLKFAKYLSLFTENEITIGYIPFERHYDELSHTLGLVTKSLPFKYSRSADLSDNQIVKGFEKQIDQLKNWSDYFSIDREDEANKASIFNYSYEFIDLKKTVSFAGFSLIDNYNVQDAFELKLSCTNFDDKINVELYFNTANFQPEQINVIQAQLIKWFENSTEENKDISTLSAIEEAIIAASNATGKEFSQFVSVLDLFEKQVKEQPAKTAVIFESKELTYQELDNKANQFANYLITNYNLKNGDAVCVLLERSDWFIISILGILKAGAYYVPVDIYYPQERIQFILEDCNAAIVLYSGEILGNSDLLNVAIIDPAADKIYSGTGLIPVLDRKPDDIAYCIYTSGSTGNPKGCLITNQNLMNYVQWSNSFYFDSSGDGNWGLITSVSFDLTVTSLFTSLTRGKKLWIGSNHADIYELLQEAFTNPAIDTLKLTPTHLSLLKDITIEQTNIKTIICGGEQLTINQIENVKRINENIHIYNEYGPTEATVGCIVRKIEKDDSAVVIGKPIANTKIFIVDENNLQTPIGVIGEIIISGTGVAKGYLNREELNKEKFIQDFSLSNQKSYKTGDIARWLPDGNIEYLGRKDSQVKIRGYRIELNEIENLLLSNEHIKEAIVFAIDEEDNKKLIAFFTSDAKLNISDLKNYLSDKIPGYMIPDEFIQVEKFMLTINGKIDRQHLINLKNKALELNVEYVAPGNDIEEKLAEIWKSILNKEKIGVNDDFFLLGGNSLLVMKLTNRIGFEFGMKIDYKLFFNKSTIKSLALEILFLIEQKSINEDNLIELDI